MDDRRDEPRARSRKYWGALLAMGLGGLMVGLGFSLGAERTGDAATGWGVLAGVGVGVALGGAILAWLSRPGARTETDTLKRDRLQAHRARQLWILPIVNIAFLVQSTTAIQDILEGTGSIGDFITAPLPVLYAWVVALIAMGWDHQSRAQRRYMEDELTQALRARAIGAAFVVLLIGATVVFGLGLWRADLGVFAMPYALALAGATAGLRFAWLDREFGKDG